MATVKETPKEVKVSSKTNESKKSSGKNLSIARRGYEDIFSHIDLLNVLSVSADDLDEATDHARRAVARAGLSVENFFAVDITTHYFIGSFGKELCGWTFSFKDNDLFRG